MSRKREGLVDLLHWSRRPSTCDQTGAKREEKATAGPADGSSFIGIQRSGRPHTSLGLSGRGPPGSNGQTLATSPTGRNGLPPLRAGSAMANPGSSSAIPSEPGPESMSHFQEALYANGQPHNATSRLLRLGAGSPNPTGGLRRAALNSQGLGSSVLPRSPSQLHRNQSPNGTFFAHLLPGVSAIQAEAAAIVASANAPSGDVSSNSLRLHHQPSTLGGHPPSSGWTTGSLGTPASTGGGSGSPPRSVQRFGARENSALMENARQVAQKATAILLSTDPDTRPEDREQAALALKQLETVLGPQELALSKLAQDVLLGPREVVLTRVAQEALMGPRDSALNNLSQEARSIREDLTRELHAPEKQSSFVRAQLKALERQHDRLRQQLRSRPEPVTLPTGPHHTASPAGLAPLPDTLPPAAAASFLSPTGASIAPPVGPPTPLDPLRLHRNLSGSISAPQSPLGARTGVPGGPSLASTSSLLRADSPLHRSRRQPEPTLRIRAPGSASNDSGSDVERPGEQRNFLNVESFSMGPPVVLPSAANRQPPPPLLPGSPTAAVDGVLESTTGGSLTGYAVLPPSERWNLAEAMERTVRIRALSRAEAAMQAVAAAHAADARPPSSGAGEGITGVDVEELRRLKYTPGVVDTAAEQPSYCGVNMRRAPSPLPGSEAVAGVMASGCSGSGAGVDPKSTLQWSNRGVSTSKMPLLREVLTATPQLVRLCLAGNKMCNEDVSELMSILSEPGAPRVHDIFLDQNTNLTWRCALPLALALGMSPDMAAAAAAADWTAVAAVLPPTSTPATILAPGAVPSAQDKVRRLDLRILSLCGVKLGDKGVAQLAEGLRVNNTLQELDVRRCGISDAGGAVLMDVLESNGRLRKLDASWNALRSETARALEVALAGNAGLRELSLAHNGFGDADGARVVKGMLSHGRWLRVDLSHNTLGPGSCVMVGELVRRLGAAACTLLAQGDYAESWGPMPGQAGSGATSDYGRASYGGMLPPLSPAGKAGSPDPLRRINGQVEPSPPASPSLVRIPHGQLGAQLADGQPALALDSNPLGSTGLRILLDWLEGTSKDMLAAAGVPPHHPETSLAPPDLVPPLPLHISIANCNVAPPSDRSSGADGADEANPFLPSLAMLCRPAAPPAAKAAGKAAGGKDSNGNAAGKKKDPKKDGGAGAKKDAGAGKGDKGSAKPASGAPSSGSAKPAVTVVHQPLTLHSPHLDLHSPAGVYSLDLSHPATTVLVAYLLRLREQLKAAVEAGKVAAGVALQIVNISINGRAAKLEKLAAVEAWTEGSLNMTVKAPAVLAIEAPTPLTPSVGCWLASLLADPTTSPLWKLSVVQGAGAVCIFTPWQCAALLAGFDRDTQSTECVAAAQMLYARSAQPLEFWEHVLPQMTPMQQQSLRERVGDLVALDMNRPLGRYNLNLSRQVDRFVALRLQLASALESSWTANKYFVNWMNASFNGQTLDRPGLTRIRDYTLPGAGVLRLDYVTYQKPGLGQEPARPEELDELLGRLRGCTVTHISALLQLRTLLQPPPPPAPRLDSRQERLRSPVGKRKSPQPVFLPPPKPRLSALQLTHMSVWEIARALAAPEHPPLRTPPSQPSAPDGHAPGPGPGLGSILLGGLLWPTRWCLVAGFNPEPLFRRTEVYPPEWALDGAPGPGPAPAPADTAPTSDLLTRALSMGAKSAKSTGGKSTASRKGPGGRRGTKEGEPEEVPPQLADYHAALLLLVHGAADLPLLAAKLTSGHLGAAVATLLKEEGGIRAVAALLAALPPLAASKFLYDQADPSPCLLPPDIRRQLLAALPPERFKLIEVAGRGASEAAAYRARGVRSAINVWASQRFVSTEQVEAVLGVLHTEGDRVAAMVALWPRLVDERWKKVYLKLKLSEQRQVMTRLGYVHVYLCLGDPHGISFSLDLGEPEQRDIARELVRMAVKQTMRNKHEARAKGAVLPPTLLDLHGNGNPVSIPEDEKLWNMADSNFKTMDFLYTPSFEQSVQQVEASAVCIQRSWKTFCARRDEREALIAQGVLQLKTSAAPTGGAVGRSAAQMTSY